MSYSKQTRPTIATPTTATEELHTNIVSKLTTHYAKHLKIDSLLSNRKGCYAMVINSTINGISLEATLGTVNAKVATEQILSAITSKYSAITIK